MRNEKVERMLPYSNQKTGLLYLDEFQISRPVPPGGDGDQMPEELRVTFEIEVPETMSILRFHYIVPRHCSDIRLHIFLDGEKKAKSPWLGPIDAKKFDFFMKFTNISAGTHTLTLQPEGMEGINGRGCNKGCLGRWGGTVIVYGDWIRKP
jgi:hypothetical protein